jgi:hypothetical protein
MKRAYAYMLKMEEACSSETLSIYEAIRRHILEDIYLIPNGFVYR